jgi:membrane protease YdiL (CAAX protease family)
MSTPDTRAPYLPAAQWSYTDTVVALGAGYLAAIVVGTLYLVATGKSAADELGVAELSITLIAQSAGHLGVAGWLSQHRGTGNWAEDFGLRIRSRDMWGIAVGVFLQLAVALVIGPIVELFAPENPPQQGVAEIAERVQGVAGRVAFVVLIVAVAPVVEEILFRGMLLSRLRRAMGTWPAILTSAAVFAVIHFVLDQNAVLAVPGLFVVGTVLGWFALRDGDLSMPIFVHAGVNLTGALVLIFGNELADAADRVGVHLFG